MKYLSELKRYLERSKLDLDLLYLGGQVVEQLLPELLYADDIVLCANSRVNL